MAIRTTTTITNLIVGDTLADSAIISPSFNTEDISSFTTDLRRIDSQKNSLEFAQRNYDCLVSFTETTLGANFFVLAKSVVIKNSDFDENGEFLISAFINIEAELCLAMYATLVATTDDSTRWDIFMVRTGIDTSFRDISLKIVRNDFPLDVTNNNIDTETGSATWAGSCTLPVFDKLEGIKTYYSFFTFD